MRSLNNKYLKSFVSNEYFVLAAIVLFSALVKFIYVFYFTDYRNYLGSDMGGYWVRAIQRLEGREIDLGQYSTMPPFFHIFLAYIFRIRGFLGLSPINLETILSINIILSTLSVVAIYFIGRKITNNARMSLLLAGVFAFSFPLIYFNSFVLSESMAIPLIVISVWLVIRFNDSYWVTISGLLLAIAVAMRPSNSFLIIPFIAYIIFHTKIADSRTLLLRCFKAAAFALIFLLVLFHVSLENYRISKGELKNLTGHTGYNLYINATNAYSIISNYHGYYVGFTADPNAFRVENGTITTSIPVHESKTYSDLAWKYIREHPGVLIRYMQDYEYLFFGNMFPAVYSAKGYIPLFDIFRYIVFGMSISLGFIYIAFKDQKINKAELWFVLGILCVSILTLFLFPKTHRYFYNFIYTVYILFFTAVLSMKRNFQRYRGFLAAYIVILVVLALASYLYQKVQIAMLDSNVHVVVTQNETPIANLDQKRNPKYSESFYVDRVYFPWSEYLKHRQLNTAVRYQYNFFMDADCNFDVLFEGKYTFFVYSDDGYRLTIDGKTVLSDAGVKSFAEHLTEKEVYLKRGMHSMTMNFFQAGGLVGLIAYYLPPTAVKKQIISQHNDFLDPNEAPKFTIGENNEFVRFEKRASKI